MPCFGASNVNNPGARWARAGKADVSSELSIPYDGLTQREREVLRLIAHGHTSKQVASSLAVSIHTVSNHRKHICRKLSLHSTAELVAFAARSLHETRTEMAAANGPT